MQETYDQHPALVSQDAGTSTSAKCPIDHAAISAQKTTKFVELPGPAIEQDADGVWHVRSFEAARAVLRSPNTKQAGFNAELIERIPGQRNPPILYQEGKAHQQQRKQTARFFTPKAVSTSYRQVMEDLSDELIITLKRQKKVDLSRLTMKMAVRVAAEIVGLTDSRIPGMDKRIEAFFAGDLGGGSGKLIKKLQMIWNQRRMLSFFYFDVQPAIAARRRSPKQDVISHLLEQKYNDAEILTECVTYGAAGMITTREFISAAAWHLLEQPALRARYVIAPEEERYAILHEILRLEPIVGNLQRRATADIKLVDAGNEVVIPNNAFINVHLHASNSDESVVGEYPRVLCPGREIQGDNIPEMLMSFGDGVHRCPGAYVAIQETDIFLTRLLALD
ncbi:MAG TPA: cytochrome P450, partial [Ktedonobacteraceae bacterium]